jgi:diacylglycerol kinase (ATP)
MTPNDAAFAKTMSNTLSFSLKKRLQSFRHAGAGIAFVLRTQHNAWIHLSITMIVCFAGVWFRFGPADWRWLAVAIILVWVAETTNTAFEYLCDVVSPEFHVAVAKAKNIAAGAVLISSAGATILGLLTFWPYLVP